MQLRRPQVLTLVAACVAMTLVPAGSGAASEPAPPEVRDALMEDLPALDAPRGEREGEAVAASQGEMTPELDAEIPFNLIGFSLPDGLTSLDVRTRDLDGRWSDWQHLELDVAGTDGPDPDTAEAAGAARNQTPPLWVGEADGLQVRVVGGSVREVTASLIDATGLSEPRRTRWARLLTSRTPTAEAADAQEADAEAAGVQAASTQPGTMGRPALVTRAQWGADESRVKSAPEYAATVQFGVVHHTAGGNSYACEQGAAVVRGIFHYHTASPAEGGQGWNDIGYNALVDRCGTIYEGRAGGLERAVIGAHARNSNTGSFGVAVLGNYEEIDIPAVAVESVARITAWKYAIHRVDASRDATIDRADGRVHPVTVGHRDVVATLCPGRFFYAKLGLLRDRIAVLTPSFDPGTLVVGDWNGDGRTTPGWFYRGSWYLRNANSTGPADRIVRFGAAGDQPVVGDWNGDGRTGLGFVRGGTWHLRDTSTAGPVDHEFVYGRLAAGDRPIAGDWTGDGRDTVGIVRAGGQWHLRNSLTAGHADLQFTYGRVASGDVPVTGDWNGDGRTTVGIVREDLWMLRFSNTGGNANRVLRFGRPGDVPLTGDWNRDGNETIGIARGQVWHLKNTIDPGASDVSFRF